MMAKRVGLRFDGTLEQGFQVTLDIGEDQMLAFTDVTGTLPPAPTLSTDLANWQQQYHQLFAATRIALQHITVQPGAALQRQACCQLAEDLQQQLNTWLGSPAFQTVEKRLRESVDSTEPVRVLLRTTDRRLHQLPWHRWEFIDRYPLAEVIFSTPPARDREPSPNAVKVKILAILGDRRGIDTDRDRQLLAALPDADVQFLVEPSRQQLNQYLWAQPWQILFFAGHSHTEAQQGRLHINPDDSLTLAELKYGLRQAITRGLQLAIFNSCDGLGLAYDLESLEIPQLIVMREPVPDRIAQEFLKHFLSAFATDHPLHRSVRQAREFLQGLEDEFPCASWLPVMFQNAAVAPLTWQGLQNHPERGQPPDPETLPCPNTLPHNTLPNDLPRPNGNRQRPKWQPVRWAIATSLAVTGLILGGRSLGLLQSWELSAFDQLMRLRPPEPPDPRLLIVTITEADIQAQTHAQEPRRGSLSDQSLGKLLVKLESYDPIAIGLDIYRDYPVSKTEPALATRLRQSDRIVSVCKVSEPEAGDPGVAPPPEVASDRLGFSDTLLDADHVVRRHYLALTPPPASPCTAAYGLSVQLALRYLATRGIALTFTPQDAWVLGPLKFFPLAAQEGGYQTNDTLGHQILLNYRAAPTLNHIAPQVTLGQVLAGQISADAVKDRLVLIGTTADSFHDSVLTPYKTAQGGVQSIPGVVLQAQMVSQLLSAALDGRSLLHNPARWIEILWIGGWAGIGGCLVCVVHRPGQLILANGVAIATLTGACLGLLQAGYWLPWVPSAIAIVSSASLTTVLRKQFPGKR
jgi:CHASE2 domain-containing sensor protein